LLRGVNLNGATLEGANLKGAALDGAHLEGALATTRTLWPDGFDWQAADVIKVSTFGESGQADKDATAVDHAAPGKIEAAKRQNPSPGAPGSGSDGTASKRENSP
jgi:hypothetical protein